MEIISETTAFEYAISIKDWYDCASGYREKTEAIGIGDKFLMESKDVKEMLKQVNSLYLYAAATRSENLISFCQGIGRMCDVMRVCYKITDVDITSIDITSIPKDVDITSIPMYHDKDLMCIDKRLDAIRDLFPCERAKQTADNPGAMTVSYREQSPPKKLPDVFYSPKAKVYWDRAINVGIVDENYMTKERYEGTSEYNGGEVTKAMKALFVDMLCEKLNIGVDYKSFEDFWGIINTSLAVTRGGSRDKVGKVKGQEVIFAIFKD